MANITNLKTWPVILIFLVVLATGATVAGKTIYVDDATGANDGSSWADAYNYLQDALAAAGSGDEIRVANGIYKPDQGANQTPGDREATFQLIDGVTLKGGYAGVGEPDTNARAINVYETILSGDLNGNDIDVNDPQDLWYEPTRSDNSYHVVSSTGKDETAILDGLTITGGSSDMRSSPHNRGGGMFNQNGSPTLNNCTFRGNWAHWWGNGSGSGSGGGMSNEGESSPTLTNCTFSGNSAGNGGGMCNSDSGPTLTNCIFRGNSSRHTAGGILNDDGSNSRLTNCTFFGNSAGSGGGICNYRSSPTITNCTFTDNRVRSSGGGVSNNQDSNPTLTNCKITGNTAGVVGGSYGRGGGMYNRDRCSPTLTNCTIIGNYSTRRGGGIYNEREGSPILTNCRITGNTGGVAGVSSGGGGGMYTESGRPTLTNCTITGNRAYDGGGVYNAPESSPTIINCTFNGNYASRRGGGLFNQFFSSPTLTNCEIVGNTAGVEGFIYGEGGGMFNRDGCNPLLINCIITGNLAKGDSGGGGGGGICTWNSKIDSSQIFINCSFAGNSAPRGNSLSYDSLGKDFPSTVQLTNCILWDSGNKIWNNDDSTITITFSNVQGLTGGRSGLLAGNINEDPLFVDPDGTDNIIGTEDDNLRLLQGSPCIDAGDNSAIPPSVVEDLDGNPRVINGIVDMGAYENSPPSPHLRAGNPSPADRATGVTQTPTLRWTAGDRALQHDVYFGTDEEDVRNTNMRSPEYKDTKDLGSESYEPGKLEWGTIYYWRVDEYNIDGTISEGRVWSFTTVVAELPEALDTNLSFTTGGNTEWFGQTTTSYYDGDAAQSGDISDDQESWMQTTVTGPITVTFYWKVSSEEDFDFLEFYIDGELQEKISGSVNWQQKTYTISTSGSHTLEWRYVKDKGMDSGSDCGWVDKLEWVPTPPPPPDPLSEVLDTDLRFTTGGSAGWFSQTKTSYHDVDAAQSGDISDDQESWMQTTVSGKGTVKFYWKVSSEEDFDRLEFYIDGVLEDQISGSVNWQQKTYTISTSGSHVLEWRYMKDGITGYGSDCGWVDKVEWVTN